MEDHPLKPAASAFPDKSGQLSLRVDTHQVQNMHVMDCDWSGSRAFFLRVFGNSRPARPQTRQGKKPSPHDRVSRLGWWSLDLSYNPDFPRKDCFASATGSTGCRSIKQG